MPNSAACVPVPAHERMRVALCLAFVGGFLEAYTYILKGGVFANAQTGNLIFLAMRLTEGRVIPALEALAPVIAFLAGVLLTERLKRIPQNTGLLQWHCIVAAVELVLLLAVALLPAGWPDIATTLTVSFVCALQFDGFRKTHGLPYATTFCTGNLRSAGEKLFRRVADHDQDAGHHARRYFTVIAVFLGGALVGSVCSRRFGQPSAFLCCAVMAAVLAFFLQDIRAARVRAKA